MAGCISPGNWFLLDRFNCPKDVLVIVDGRILPEQVPTGMKVWFVNVEPEAILPFSDYLCANWKLFEHIFTFNQHIIETCPNAIKYIHGTTWFPPSVWNSVNPQLKQFSVSSITGGKAQTIGHKFRLELFKNQHKCPMPSVWFQSHNANISFLKPNNRNNTPRLGDSKLPLFEKFQFSLVIENSRQKNYFTEKLLDCLLTKTIPIYYGCPNISEFFDTRGWIILENESVDDAFSKLSQLVPAWYPTCLPVIEDNHARAQKYFDLYANLNASIPKDH